jgi:hypothetical protein
MTAVQRSSAIDVPLVSPPPITSTDTPARRKEPYTNLANLPPRHRSNLIPQRSAGVMRRAYRPPDSQSRWSRAGNTDIISSSIASNIVKPMRLEMAPSSSGETIDSPESCPGRKASRAKLEAVVNGHNSRKRSDLCDVQYCDETRKHAISSISHRESSILMPTMMENPDQARRAVRSRTSPWSDRSPHRASSNKADALHPESSQD